VRTGRLGLVAEWFIAVNPEQDSALPYLLRGFALMAKEVVGSLIKVTANLTPRLVPGSEHCSELDAAHVNLLPALVLAHGGGLTADSWHLTVNAIQRFCPELTVLAVDLPGRRASHEIWGR
jgi:pimeloyl-ACP methyl ester carboxylesterase